jgi:hypothetical protein
VARVVALRTRIQQRKVAMRHERELLQEDAAALAELEAACRARGISIQAVPMPTNQPTEA